MSIITKFFFKENRFKVYSKDSVRNLLLSLEFFLNIFQIPKIRYVKLAVTYNKKFKNIFLSALCLLLFISKNEGHPMKNTKINHFKKKKSYTGLFTKLSKNSLFIFLDNLISIILPLNLELLFNKIYYKKNKLINFKINNLFNFFELEDFFEEQKERNLIEKFLFLNLNIILEKLNINLKKLLKKINNFNQSLLALYRIPLFIIFF